MSNGRTVSNKDKKLSGGTGGKTASDLDKKFKKLSGGSGGRTASDLDKSMVSRIYALARGVISRKAMSDKDFMNALKKIRDAKKKGKPHLKHGGKAKKKYGVVGKPTLKKGGKV